MKKQLVLETMYYQENTNSKAVDLHLQFRVKKKMTVNELVLFINRRMPAGYVLGFWDGHLDINWCEIDELKLLGLIYDDNGDMLIHISANGIDMWNYTPDRINRWLNRYFTVWNE